MILAELARLILGCFAKFLSFSLLWYLLSPIPALALADCRLHSDSVPPIHLLRTECAVVPIIVNNCHYSLMQTPLFAEASRSLETILYQAPTILFYYTLPGSSAPDPNETY